jgi:hypothetical protein
MSAALFDEQSPFIQRDSRTHRPLLKTTAKLLNLRHETMVPQAIVEGRSVLDIGCALAATGKWVLDRGAQCYVGVEPQKEYVDLATEMLASYPAASIVCERGMEFFSSHDARYDVVTLIGVLHGQFDVLDFLKSACELANDYVCIETQGDDATGPVMEPVDSIWMPIAGRNQSSRGFGWIIAPKALHRIMRYLGFVPDMEPVFVDTNVGYNFFRYAMRYKRVAERGATAGDFVNIINWSDVPPPPMNDSSNNMANDVAHTGVHPGARTNNMENFDLDELTALARLDIEQGRVEQGLSKLKCILPNPYAPAAAISMAARLYAQMKLFDRAETLFIKYLSMAAGALEEQFQLGMVQLDKGDSARALETWGGLLKQQPTFPPALFYCAMVQHKIGKLADARRNLDVLLQTVPADNLYYGRGKELLHAMDRDAIQ